MVAPSQSTIVPLYASWNDRVYVLKGTNAKCKKLWQTIPKSIWWIIWLARNDYIFNGIPPSPKDTTSKVKRWILESTSKLKNISTMSSDFVVWLGISPTVIGRNVSFLKPI